MLFRYLDRGVAPEVDSVRLSSRMSFELDFEDLDTASSKMLKACLHIPYFA